MFSHTITRSTWDDLQRRRDLRVQRFLLPRFIAARFAGARFFARAAGGFITLCICITLGGAGSAPSSLRIGISVLPNLSNAACDVHTSKIMSLSAGPKVE